MLSSLFLSATAIVVSLLLLSPAVGGGRLCCAGTLVTRSRPIRWVRDPRREFDGQWQRGAAFVRLGEPSRSCGKFGYMARFQLDLWRPLPTVLIVLQAITAVISLECHLRIGAFGKVSLNGRTRTQRHQRR